MNESIQSVMTFFCCASLKNSGHHFGRSTLQTENCGYGIYKSNLTLGGEHGYPHLVFTRDPTRQCGEEFHCLQVLSSTGVEGAYNNKGILGGKLCPLVWKQ